MIWTSSRRIHTGQLSHRRSRASQGYQRDNHAIEDGHAAALLDAHDQSGRQRDPAVADVEPGAENSHRPNRLFHFWLQPQSFEDGIRVV